MAPYACGHPGAQQRVGDVVAPPGQRHGHDGGGRHPVARREDGPYQCLGRQRVRSGRGHRDDDERVSGDGPRGVRDLGQLRPVQWPVRDYAQHPPRWQRGPDLVRGQPEPAERPVRGLADAPYLTTRTAPSLAGGPDVHRVQGRDRGTLGIGEYEHPLERIRRVERGDQAGRHLQADLDLPRGAVGEAGPPSDRVEVGAGMKADQRRQRPRQEQLEIRQLPRSRSVGRSVPKQLLGQHPPVHETP